MFCSEIHLTHGLPVLHPTHNSLAKTKPYSGFPPNHPHLVRWSISAPQSLNPGLPYHNHITPTQIQYPPQYVSVVHHDVLHTHNFSCLCLKPKLCWPICCLAIWLHPSTWAKYVQHGGRQNLSAWDVFCALDELGISIAELGEYCNLEGAELGRYSINMARQMEELKDFRGELPYYPFISRLLTLLSSTPYQRVQARPRRYNPLGLCAPTRRSVVRRERWRCWWRWHGGGPRASVFTGNTTAKWCTCEPDESTKGTFEYRQSHNTCFTFITNIELLIATM
jgi:hypothetical protein